MRLKSHKGHKMVMRRKQRSAYWRGEKILIFFKRGIIVLSIFILIMVVILAVKLSARYFVIRNILVSGNYYLEEDEIINAVDVRDGESLLRISFNDLETRISHIGWIKNMSLRKQFPDTLMINVKEADPKALLRFKKHMFLVDSDGRVLEEIRGSGMSFLPVIVEIDPGKDRGGILEVLRLIDVLDEKNIISGKESIEIMLKSYGPELNMDGETVKVGYGKYREKLLRWKELEPEIAKKNINIDYVDLRFKDKVIVKPLKKK